jgi:hypothetical protein
MIPVSEVVPRVLNFRANPNHRRAPIDCVVGGFRASNRVFVALTNLDCFVDDRLPLDQGGTGSCEGNSHVAGIYVAMAAAGDPLPWMPSADGAYKVARCIERGGAKRSLKDDGTESSYVCLGFNLWGIRRMGAPVQDPGEPARRNSDCSVLTINDEPTLLELEAAALNVFVGQYNAEGEDNKSRINAVNLALSRGYPCTIGGLVDTNYMRWEPADGVYQRVVDDPDGGGHSQLIIGNRINNVGLFEYLILNSWGSWCQNGRIWVSQEFILDADEITALHVRKA